MKVDCVWRSLQATYSGPYTVIQQTTKYFPIKTSDDVQTQVLVVKLKLYLKIQKLKENKTRKEKLQ